MQFWRVVATTAVLVLAGASTARADVRYVSADGDATQCTEDDPCALGVAPSVVNDGDEVLLLSSSFTAGDVASRSA